MSTKCYESYWVLEAHQVQALALLSVVYSVCERRLFRAKCYFSLCDSTCRLLLELWLNYKELLRANQMTHNLFT